MRTHWTLAALLSSALLVGCGGRDAQNPDENGAAPDTAAQADRDQGNREAVSPDRDAPGTEGARPTTGSRPATGSSTRREIAPRESAPRRESEPSRLENARTPAPAPAPRPAFREVTVPAGTALPLELMTDLTSNTAAVETPVRARLRQTITMDGYTAIPAGTVFSGNVTEADDAGRVKGRAHLAFRFTEAEINGTREDVRTNPLSFEAEATKGEDATKIGAGAGIGAAIGGLLGGGSGAAKGAAIGGAAGTGAVLATKGKEVKLPIGTDLAATLASPVTVRVAIK